MRIVIIGGAGHIGTYLTPRLVEAGHTVLNVSRGQSRPYQTHPAWSAVETVTLDRAAAEADRTFGPRLAALHPDAVIDLICYTLESVRHLVPALSGNIAHFLHCGTIWVHGRSIEVPLTEDAPRHPTSDYGVRKVAIESYLVTEARVHNFPATVLHPGHIVGRGWVPLNPAANFNPAVFTALARGEELALPNIGMETLHHVHADDVAQAFVQALNHRSVSLGESFHVVSPAALTLAGYAEIVASWFNRPANLKFVPWETWAASVSEKEARITWDHISRSPNCSIAKAARLLEYRPRYRSPEAVRDALSWLLENRQLEI